MSSSFLKYLMVCCVVAGLAMLSILIVIPPHTIGDIVSYIFCGMIVVFYILPTTHQTLIQQNELRRMEQRHYFRKTIYIAFKKWKHDSKLNPPPKRVIYGLCSYMLENNCFDNPFRERWESEYGNRIIPFGSDFASPEAYRNEKRIQFVDDYIEAYEKFNGIREHG